MFGPFGPDYDIETKPGFLVDQIDQCELTHRLLTSTINLDKAISIIAKEREYVEWDSIFLTPNELQDKNRYERLKYLYFFLVDLFKEITEKDFTEEQLKDIEKLLDEVAMRPDLLSDRFSIIQ